MKLEFKVSLYQVDREPFYNDGHPVPLATIKDFEKDSSIQAPE